MAEAAPLERANKKVKIGYQSPPTPSLPGTNNLDRGKQMGQLTDLSLSFLVECLIQCFLLHDCFLCPLRIHWGFWSQIIPIPFYLALFFNLEKHRWTIQEEGYINVPRLKFRFGRFYLFIHFKRLLFIWKECFSFPEHFSSWSINVTMSPFGSCILLASSIYALLYLSSWESILGLLKEVKDFDQRIRLHAFYVLWVHG